MRQVVLADHDFDVHAEIVRMAQDLHHPAHRVVVLVLRIFDDLDVDDHPVQFFRAADRRRGDPDAVRRRPGARQLHALRDSESTAGCGLVRHHVVLAPPHAKLADHRGMGPLPGS